MSSSLYTIRTPLCPGNPILIRPLTSRVNGAYLDPTTAEYHDLVMKFLEPSNRGDPITTQAALWYDLCNALTDQNGYRAWDEASDGEMVRRLFPNTEAALNRVPTLQSVQNTAYAVSPQYGPYLAMAYGNMKWKGVKTRNLSPTSKGSVILATHEADPYAYTFYTHPEAPGVVLIDEQSDEGKTRMWASFEGLLSWMQAFQDRLGDDTSVIEHIYTAYLELRQQMLAAIASQLLTLRMTPMGNGCAPVSLPGMHGAPWSSRMGGLVPTMFQPACGNARLLTALTLDELQAFAGSKNTSYVVRSPYDMQVITNPQTPPYTTNSMGMNVNAYLSALSSQGGLQASIPLPPGQALQNPSIAPGTQATGFMQAPTATGFSGMQTTTGNGFPGATSGFSGTAGTGISGVGTGFSGSGTGFSGSGTGFSGSGATGTGFSGSGATGTGFSGSGATGTGFSGLGATGTGFSGSGATGTGFSGSEQSLVGSACWPSSVIPSGSQVSTSSQPFPGQAFSGPANQASVPSTAQLQQSAAPTFTAPPPPAIVTTAPPPPATTTTTAVVTAPTAVVTAPTTTLVTAPLTTTATTFPTWAIVLIVLIVLAVIGVGVYFFMRSRTPTHKPSARVETYQAVPGPEVQYVEVAPGQYAQVSTAGFYAPSLPVNIVPATQGYTITAS